MSLRSTKGQLMNGPQGESSGRLSPLSESETVSYSFDRPFSLVARDIPFPLCGAFVLPSLATNSGFYSLRAVNVCGLHRLPFPPKAA